jgi:hypothetical protein
MDLQERVQVALDEIRPFHHEGHVGAYPTTRGLCGLLGQSNDPEKRGRDYD